MAEDGEFNPFFDDSGDAPTEEASNPFADDANTFFVEDGSEPISKPTIQVAREGTFPPSYQHISFNRFFLSSYSYCYFFCFSA